MRWVSARRVDLVWLIAFGLVSSAWCVTAVTQLGAVFDEPFYIKAGLTKWRTASNKPLMRAGVMPLPTDVQTLPIFLWERCRGQEFDPAEDLHTVLPLARTLNLAFWWLLLVYTMRLGRTFGGAWGGRLTVALTACDPNLLGHACFAITDIASVACLLVLVYHVWHGLGCGWKRRVLLPGLCYGLAMQAKATGMVFGMEAMVVLGLWHLAHNGELAAPAGSRLRGWITHLWHAMYPLRRDVTQIALIGFASLFLYVGTDWKAEPGFVKWAESLPDGDLKSVMVPVSHDLRIFTNAGEGLLFQIKHNLSGHGTYLLGTWYERATWQYFFVALSMKLPLAVMALFAAALVVHPRYLLTPLAAVALLYLALSPTCRVQIGVRFMFPAMVLGYIALAAAIARGWEATDSRCVPKWFTAIAIAALAVTSVIVWPHGLSYINQLWGGTAAGPRLLNGSNYDWGQGLPELAAWAEARGKPVAVWYYGMDPAMNRPPLLRTELDGLPHHGTPAGIRWACRDRPFLAVSVGILHGNDDWTVPRRQALDWLRTQTPIARTRFFVIYRLP